MNKMILLAAILCIGCTAANATVYLNDDIPANSGSSTNNSYTRTDVSKIDNTYYMWNNNTQTYSYEKV